MSTAFTADFFTRNRRKLGEAIGPDNLVVITANGQLQRTADNSYGFTQEKNFWYLSGIVEPDITLVIDGGQEYLIVPGRSVSRQAFDGAVDPAQLAATSGVQMVLDETAGYERLSKAIRKHKKVHTPAALPMYVDALGMYPNPARARLAETLQGLLAAVELIDIRPQFAELRVIKQAIEIEAIQQAVDVTIDGLLDVIKHKNAGVYTHEYQIEADLSRAFRQTGAGGHAFLPIVAGGIRACTFHNFSNQSELRMDELVVLDVGAEWNQYSADLTRTIALQEPSQRQQDVFDAVREAQEYGIGLLKPGISFKDCEAQVRRYMGKKLKQLKLIDTIDEESIHKYYPHAPHYLGLDVHDAGDYSRPLEPGMVLTCEPGIYIPEEGIGVRIEDDIVITETGHRVLSARLPKTLM